MKHHWIVKYRKGTTIFTLSFADLDDLLRSLVRASNAGYKTETLRLRG